MNYLSDDAPRRLSRSGKQANNDRREWNSQGRQDLLVRWNKLTHFLPPKSSSGAQMAISATMKQVNTRRESNANFQLQVITQEKKWVLVCRSFTTFVLSHWVIISVTA